MSKKSIMDEHVYIKEMYLRRDVKSGNMEVALVVTNKGKFFIGDDTNQKLTSQTQELYQHLRDIIIPDIISALRREEEDTGAGSS